MTNTTRTARRAAASANARARRADGTFLPKADATAIAMETATPTTPAPVATREVGRSAQDYAREWMGASPALRTEIATTVAARAKVARRNVSAWTRLATAMASSDEKAVSMKALSYDDRKPIYAAAKAERAATTAPASLPVDHAAAVALTTAHTLRKPAKAKAAKASAPANVDAEAALVARITAAVLAAMKAGA